MTADKSSIRGILVALDRLALAAHRASAAFQKARFNELLDEMDLHVLTLQEKLEEARRLNNMTDAELYELGLRDYERSRESSHPGGD